MCDLKVCSDDESKFCRRLDQVRALENVAEWCAKDPVKVTINGYESYDYGDLCVVEWTSVMGDNNAGWQAFVLALIKFLAGVCHTHLGPIGANNGTQAKHVVDKAFRKGRFQELLYAISLLTNEHVAKIAQSRLVDFICGLPGEDCAEWFETYWTGEQKGR